MSKYDKLLRLLRGEKIQHPADERAKRAALYKRVFAARPADEKAARLWEEEPSPTQSEPFAELGPPGGAQCARRIKLGFAGCGAGHKGFGFRFVRCDGETIEFDIVGLSQNLEIGDVIARLGRAMKLP